MAPHIKSPPVEILYYVAEDFCSLEPTQQFNIGMDLNLLTPEDAHLNPKIIEELVFTRMWSQNKFEKFVQLLYTAMGYSDGKSGSLAL